MEKMKSNEMSKEAQQSGGEVGEDSSAAGVQSMVDKKTDTPDFPVEQKRDDMSKQAKAQGGEITEGSRAAGGQKAADTITNQS